jgi:hypothetical protein
VARFPHCLPPKNAGSYGLAIQNPQVLLLYLVHENAGHVGQGRAAIVIKAASGFCASGCGDTDESFSIAPEQRVIRLDFAGRYHLDFAGRYHQEAQIFNRSSPEQNW